MNSQAEQNEVKGKKIWASRRRRMLFGVIALALGFLGALTTAEVALRLFSDEGDALLVKDAVVGQRYRAHYTGARFNPEALRPVSLRFNSLGFRGPDYPIEAPAGVRRIVLLGDSYTAAVQVEEKDTVASRLQERLNESTDESTRWEVLNFGISGYGTAQSLLTWRNFARQYRPEVVFLLFYNGNDLADNHSGLSSAHRPYFTLKSDGVLELLPLSENRVGVSRFLAEHSRFYVWQREKLRSLRDRFRDVTKTVSPGFQILNQNPTGAAKESWDITFSLLKTLNEEVSATGAQLHLVSIPAHEQILPAFWNRLIETVGSAQAKDFAKDHPERQLASFCTQHGIPFLPLREPLGVAAKSAPVHFTSAEYCHWNEHGQAVATDAILEHFTNVKLAVRPKSENR